MKSRVKKQSTKEKIRTCLYTASVLLKLDHTGWHRKTSDCVKIWLGLNIAIKLKQKLKHF